MNKLLPILKLGSPIVFQGWMFKRGGLLSTWKERWFCLCSDNTLRIIYNGGIARYCIDITMMLSKAQFSWNVDVGTIKLECIGRNWLFMVYDEKQFQGWRKHLNQVNQYPINQVSSMIMLGVLQKRGQVNKMWRKRFCQLNRNGIFLYFKCDATGNIKGKVKGHFSLYHSTVMKVDGEDERYFSIHQPDRTWYFRANSIEDARKWRRIINRFVVTSHVTALKDEPSNRNSGIPIKKNLDLLSVNSHAINEFDRSHHQINSHNPLKSLTFRKGTSLGKMLSIEKRITASPQERKEDLPADKKSISVDQNLSHRRDRPSYSTSAINRRLLDLSSQKNSKGASWDPAKIGRFQSDRDILPVNYRPDSLETARISATVGNRPNETSLDWGVRLRSVKSESSMITLSLQSDQIDPRLLFPSDDWVEHDHLPFDLERSVSDDDSSNATLNTRSSMDGVDDWTYTDVLRSAFYRFAGVSPYSNTNLKMSKADLEMLLVCLNLQQHCDRLYESLATDCRGLFAIEDFMDCFLNRETCSRITKTTEYKFLVVTLMTMKNIDPSYSKRISYEDFHILLESFFDDQDETEEIFQKYDTDGGGRLHVANLFCFLRDYCVLEEDEEEQKYDEMKDCNTFGKV